MAKTPCMQGLLDLEGTALTPILVSLVKKDAGLLDAFGKGASEDIQVCQLYMTRSMTGMEGGRAGRGGCVSWVSSSC